MAHCSASRSDPVRDPLVTDVRSMVEAFQNISRGRSGMDVVIEMEKRGSRTACNEIVPVRMVWSDFCGPTKAVS